ncbi:MAG: hypothetical protein JNL70_25910 [Saprospiraceae bacterium]|nr:hypothetical protein [Saprospiraceae bacterium]
MAITKFPTKLSAAKKVHIDQPDMTKFLSARLKKANQTILARVAAKEKVPVFESVYFSAEDLKAVLRMDAQGNTTLSGAFFYLSSLSATGTDNLTLIGVGAAEDGTLMTDALTSGLACPPDCPVWKEEI